MVSKCSAPGCQEYTSRSSASFHHYPKSIYRSRKWLSVLRLKQNFKLSAALVCSKHFSFEQYKENGNYSKNNDYPTLIQKKLSLVGLLKANAVPDQNLPKKEFVSNKLRRSPKKRETKPNDTLFIDTNDCSLEKKSDDSEDPLIVSTEPSLCVGECSYKYRPEADQQKIVLKDDPEMVVRDDDSVSTEVDVGANMDVMSGDIVEQDSDMELTIQRYLFYYAPLFLEMDTFRSQFFNHTCLFYSLSNGEHCKDDHQAAQLQINPFQYSALSDEKIKYLTGHTKSEFDSILDLATHGQEEKDVWFPILPLREQLLLTLTKCRMNFDYVMLGIMFHLSDKKVSEIFKFWIKLLHKTISKIDFWALRAQDENLYTVVLDCTEFPIQKPTSPEEQQTTWSSYKNTNTFKALIGTDENGMVTYVSEVYGGAITDNLIVEKSNILDYLKAGDFVLSDRGFELSDLLAERGIILNKPPNKRGQQMSEKDVALTRAVASRRVHVERVIGLAKTNRIISQKIPHSLFDLVPKIIPLLFYLVNFKPSICKPVDTKCLCPN